MALRTEMRWRLCPRAHSHFTCCPGEGGFRGSPRKDPRDEGQRGGGHGSLEQHSPMEIGFEPMYDFKRLRSYIKK